jgi:N-acetylneuraminate synthase
LGKVNYGILEAEKGSLTYKRSIYVVKDIKAGEILTTDNIRIIRPGLGLQPKYFDLVIGKKAKVAIKRGTALSFDLLF